MSPPREPGQRPADSPGPRDWLLNDLDGRLAVPAAELRDGETIRELVARLLGPPGFTPHLIRGTSRHRGGL